MKQLPLSVVLVIVLATAASAIGCGSYRVVSEARGGGTVALQGAHDSARAKAERYMRDQCPAGFEVIEEGDTATIGVEREWRLTYVCSGTRAPKTAMIAF